MIREVAGSEGGGVVGGVDFPQTGSRGFLRYALPAANGEKEN